MILRTLFLFFPFLRAFFVELLLAALMAGSKFLSAASTTFFSAWSVWRSAVETADRLAGVGNLALASASASPAVPELEKKVRRYRKNYFI